MINTLDSIISALAGTPVWVWGVLAYLIFIGIRATKNRRLHPLTLFIMPIIFMLINYRFIFSANNFLFYIICLITGLLIGLIIAIKKPIRIFLYLTRIELTGDYYTIALLILFFLAKYILGYLEATRPAMIIEYSFIDTSISGLLSGYFLGVAICYLARYYLKCGVNNIHCQEPWFSKIRDGIKKIEGRKYSSKYASLQAGEAVKFFCDQKSFLVEVVKVEKYANLEEYLTAEGVENVLPGVKSFNEAVDIYLGFNSREKLDQADGFLAIHVKLI